MRRRLPHFRRLACLGFVLFAGAGYATMSHAQTSMDAATGVAANDDAGMAMDMGAMQGGSAPPDARDPHAWSEGVGFTRGDARPRFADEESMRSILIENLEIARVDGDTLVPFDVDAWFGQTYRRVVLRAEGDFERGDLAEARTELLWGRAFAAFWDTQLGVRYDSGAGPNRTWLAAGIEGLAPYWFDLEVTAYLGNSSRTALRIDAAYDMLISQRLILQPSVEANFYGRDDLERGIGDGLAELSFALRLRYEIRRELAPYIGVEWNRQYGDTEDLTRAAGGDPSDARLMMGLRFWF